MNPQENTKPSTSSDDPADTTSSIPTSPTPSDPSTVSFDPNAVAPDPSASSAASVGVDLNDESANVPSSTANISGSFETPAPVEEKIDTNPALPSISSEVPATPVVDQTTTPGTVTPPVVTDVPATPAVTDAPVDPTADFSSNNDQPAGVTPATSPIPAHATDKKTIIVLGAVAAGLIIAILVLFLK